MPRPDARSASSARRVVVAAIAVVVSVIAISAGLVMRGEPDAGPRVFELEPGERRYWEPGQVLRGDLMRCHDQLYALRDGSVDTVSSTGVSVGHATDGSVIATCPRDLDPAQG
jgi:hypothetical protein